MTFTRNRLPWPLIAILGIYAVIGLTMRPVGDDWCEMLAVQQHGFLGGTLFWYQQWSGRFGVFIITDALYTLFGSWLAAILPAMLLIGMVWAWTLAMRSFTDKATLIAAGITYGIVAGMPNIFQGLFYPAASLLYFAPLILSGVLAAALIRKWHPLIVFALAVFIGGCSEPHAALQILILMVGLWRFRSRAIAAALAGTVLGLGIALMAPGNAIRAAAEPSWITMDAFVYSIQAIVNRIVATATETPLALLVPFSIGLVVGRGLNLSHVNTWIIRIAVGSLLLAWLSILPTILVIGWDPVRIYTIAQALFAAAACSTGALLGSRRNYSHDVAGLMLWAALLLTLGFTIHYAPTLIAEAIFVDRGYSVPDRAIRTATMLDDEPRVVACRAGDLSRFVELN